VRSKKDGQEKDRHEENDKEEVTLNTREAGDEARLYFPSRCHPDMQQAKLHRVNSLRVCSSCPLSCGALVKTGVIILFHGSRVKGSEEAVLRIIGEIRRRGGYSIVEGAYLQYASPSLGESIQTCVQQHAEKIVIVPFFMLSGAHVTKDIPAIVEKAKKQYPDLEIAVTDFVGSHPLMIEIVLDLIGENT